MKNHHRFIPWILLGFVLFAISRAPGETAWQAFDALKAQRGAAALKGITKVRGQNGQDQPPAWEISTNVADGERVYVVQRGRIVGDTIYSSGTGVPVDIRRLRVDSGEVFTIANRVATESKVGFDSIDYELSANGLGNAPLWLIFVRDAQGKDLGEIEISGENGEVLRRSWFPARVAYREPIEVKGATRRRALRSHPSAGAVAGNEERGGVLERTAEGASGAAEKVKEGFQHLGESLGHIFRQDETYPVNQQESRHKAPKTLRRR